MLELTTPGMLWGLLGLGLPIAAHLSRRRVNRVVEFPSIGWLMVSAAGRTRLSRWRDGLLLLLRCLVIGALVLAFAKPVWLGSGGVQTMGKNGRIVRGAWGVGGIVVVVIDASASMQWVESGMSRRHVAGNTVEQIIGRLQIGRDRVAVVVATDQPYTMFPEPVWDLELASRQVRGWFDSAGIFDTRADMAGAIDLAHRIIADGGGGNNGDVVVGRLVVVSDMQASQWADVGGDVGGNVGGGMVGGVVGWSGFDVTVVGIGAGDSDNRSVDSVSVWPARPILRAAVGGGGNDGLWVAHTQLFGQVTNHHSGAAVVRVRAVLDGVVVAAQNLTIDAGQVRDVVFDLMVGESGEHRASIVVDDDALAIDNRVACDFRVVDRVRALLVSEQDPDVADTAGYFVARALSPDGNRLGVVVEHTSRDAMIAGMTNGVDVVVMTEPGEITMVDARALVAYVRGGGGLIWFVDDESNWAMLDQAMGGQLPWEIDSWVDGMGLGTGISVGGGAWGVGHGAWGGGWVFFEFDERSRQALERLRFNQYWSVGGGVGEQRGLSDDLLWYADGTPVMAMVRYGDGCVATVNFSPTRGGGDLVTRGLFVAIMHGLVDRVRESQDSQDSLERSVVMNRVDARESEPGVWQGDLNFAMAGDGDSNGGQSGVGDRVGDETVFSDWDREIEGDRFWMLWPWLVGVVLVGLAIESWLVGRLR